MKKLMKGNEAIGEGAIAAGCRFFFGYPITPQNEIPEHLSWRMPEVGGTFLQAESEVAAINMVYGASAAGARVMTSSSSPGISLKMEGISYLVGAQLPAVVVNIQRGGPGLGSIQPGQSDYLQATKGGGHGDYNMIVLAPSSVQEIFDLTKLAFELADLYRNPVMILGDGLLGQMMEAVEQKESAAPVLPEKPWATTGCKGREKNIVNSLFLEAPACEQHNIMLQKKFAEMAKNEQRHEAYLTEDAEILTVAYGASARIVKGAVDAARAEGIKVGLFRPISVWPYPSSALAFSAKNASDILVVEMNAGQMIDDVRLSVDCQLPVHFYGRTGGVIPDSRDVLQEIRRIGGK